MKKLKVKKDYEYDRIGSFTHCNPYQILFVYTPDEAFIIKGGTKDIERWLLINSDKPMMINKTWWRHGRHRSMWDIVGLKEGYNAYISSRIWATDNIKKTGKPYVLRIHKNNNVVGSTLVLEKPLRRIPRKWMKELTPYI